MSMTALTGAVLARLQSALSLDGSSSSISYDGQPPAFSGEEFFVVHPWFVQNTEGDRLDEKYGVVVTVTRRTGYPPQDRMGSDVTLYPTTGLYKRADAVKVALHKNYTVLNLAGGTCVESGGPTWTGGETYSIAATENGFVEPLVFDSYSDRPMVKGPEWFWAEAEGMDPPSGIALEVRFKDARRIQTLTDME